MHNKSLVKTRFGVLTLILYALSVTTTAQPGRLDETFHPQTQEGTRVKACALQNDGKLIIAGDFPGGITRLNDDGSLDNSFATGTGANNTVAALAIQGDGKVVIGGSFTSYDGVNVNRITRLNTDGSLDNSFNVGSGLDTSWFSAYSFGVHALAIQNDGKVLAGGNFQAYNGEPVQNLVRLHPDGMLDSTFMSISGPDLPVLSISLQNDGMVIIGGRFSYSPGGFIHGFIARLSPEGVVDTAFTQNVTLGPTNVSEVRTTAVQEDGRILIGGSFNYCNGVAPTKRLCRLNSDGTLDAAFQLNQILPSTYYKVNASVVLPGGSILVGGTGSFSDTLNRVVRLNGNGTLDTSFSTGAGVSNGDIYAVAVQDDGKMIICGDFSACDGQPRNGVARLHGEGTSEIKSMDGPVVGSRIIPNPNNGVFSVCTDDPVPNTVVSIFDPLGKKVCDAIVKVPCEASSIDISHVGRGTYYVLIQNADRLQRHKVIVW